MVTYAPIACKHKVSDSISLPSRGSFHLSLTVLYAIGHWVVFSLRGWAPCVPTELHVLGGTLRIPTNFPFAYGTFTLCGKTFQTSSARKASYYGYWAGPRSLAATRGIEVSFFSFRYLDVSVPGVTFTWPILNFSHGYIHITVCGLPHSEICGLTVICTCPQLIAAYHVLLRLPVPRHPPCALSHLTLSESPLMSNVRGFYWTC